MEEKKILNRKAFFSMAAWSQSFWFLTMGVYYMLICFMRALALLLNSNEKAENADSIVLKQSGLLMFMSSRNTREN